MTTSEEHDSDVSSVVGEDDHHELFNQVSTKFEIKAASEVHHHATVDEKVQISKLAKMIDYSRNLKRISNKN